MASCQCRGIEHEFSEGEALSQLRRYRRRGAAGTTRELIEVLIGLGVERCSLLDIGGGVGAIQHGLLAAGASRARSVEASRAYIEIARVEAERRGWTARIETSHGDFVTLAATIEPADIVTLDRVICCYDDMRALVAASAARARRLYGLVYPRDAWWLRPLFALGNLVFRVRRSPFRIFLHRTTEVEALIAAAGLRPAFHRTHGMWQVSVFRS